MVYEISLTARAEKDFYLTVDYLLEKWTITEARNYLVKLEELKSVLSLIPNQFEFYDRKRNIRKVPLTKHNLVFYRVDEIKKRVVILTIFNVYQNPNKLGL